jgi:hypothetical protein
MLPLTFAGMIVFTISSSFYQLGMNESVSTDAACCSHPNRKILQKVVCDTSNLLLCKKRHICMLPATKHQNVAGRRRA